MISMHVTINSNNYLITLHYTTINCYCLITICDFPTVKETPYIGLEIFSSHKLVKLTSSISLFLLNWH